MKLLKYENSKLKQQFIFNLPVSHAICGRQCPGCYALKAQLRFPKVVVPYREARHKASLRDDFVATVVNELSSSRRSARTVRVHESGEFYSQQYILKWQAIAEALPSFTFYAFTKRIKDFDFSSLKALPNFVVIDSLHFGRINYGEPSAAPANAHICPVTQHKPVNCGTTCRYCMSKKAQTNGIWFNKH